MYGWATLTLIQNLIPNYYKMILKKYYRICLMSVVDYLVEDTIVPSNQKFCALSIWLNDDKTKVKLFKVSAAFKYVNEAEYQFKLMKERGHLNFVAEMGKWNAFDPTRLEASDLDNELNRVMKRHLENQTINNFEYEIRKNELVIKNISDNIKQKNTELSEQTDEKYITKIMSQIETLEKKRKEYDDKLVEFKTKLDNFKSNTSNQVLPPIVKKEQHYESVNEDFSWKTTERVDTQAWFCVSFLGEENSSLVGIKISGAFEKEDEAQDFAKSLRDINDSVNVYVGPLYKWMPFNPKPDSEEAGESEYSNPQLNETMKEKKRNEQKAKIYHEFRKNEEIKRNIEEMINMRKSEISETNDKTTESLEEQIRKLEDKLKEYETKNNELTKDLNNLTMPDDKSKLYMQMISQLQH